MQSHDYSQRQVSSLDVDCCSGRIRSMHDVFCDPYRQAILYRLQRTSDHVDLGDLADWVHDRCDEVDDRAAGCTRAWLLHRHVLSLDEFGLVEYDPDADTVALADDVCITVSLPGE